MLKLPEGMRASLTIYFKTDIGGAEADLALTIDGFTAIPEFPENLDAEKIASRLKLDVPLDFTKTRLMTAAEIAEYRRGEEEEE